MPRSTNKNKGKEKAAWTSNSNDVVTVDWRGAEWMTPIRHQMMTSICWAITLIDIIEMLYSQATGKKIELSEQDLLDYCSTYPRYCKGFNLSKAFEHVKEHGIAYLKYYPYTGCGGARPPLHTRNFRPEQKFDQVVDYVVLGTETAIEEALKKHPVIGHAVLTDNLQAYESGLHFPGSFGKAYTDPETGQKKFECQASHCVILVGYGQEGGIPYWIVKNSWGENWGENGYAKLARCQGVQRFTGYYPLFKNE